MLHKIITAIVVIVALSLISMVMHDDRVQGPYKTILGIVILAAVALLGWYCRTHFAWW